MHTPLRLLAASFLMAVAVVPAAAQAQTPAAPATPSAAAATTPAPAPLTPDTAKPLLGDWNISASGSMGPASMLLSLKVADGKLVGELASDQGKNAITDITKKDATVILRYSFDYQGMPISAVLTLDPGADADTLAVGFDFADGAYQMGGTAARKKTF